MMSSANSHPRGSMKVEKKLRFSGIAILIVMLLTTMIPFQITSWVQSAQNDIAQVRRASRTLDNLLSLVKDAETGQRGFIITGKESFLEPYHAAQTQIGQAKLALNNLSIASD